MGVCLLSCPQAGCLYGWMVGYRLHSSSPQLHHGSLSMSSLPVLAPYRPSRKPLAPPAPRSWASPATDEREVNQDRPMEKSVMHAPRTPAMVVVMARGGTPPSNTSHQTLQKRVHPHTLSSLLLRHFSFAVGWAVGSRHSHSRSLLSSLRVGTRSVRQKPLMTVTTLSFSWPRLRSLVCCSPIVCISHHRFSSHSLVLHALSIHRQD